MLRYRIATQGVGTKLDVTLLRGGRTEKVALTLARPPETPARSLTTIGGDNLLAGVTVGNLSPAFAQELGAGLPEHGVVVTAIAGGAPAARFGYLQPGDIVEAVNGRLVGSVAAVGEAVRSGVPSVRINRGGQRQECGVVDGQLACRS
jgi:serine protease Do